MTRILANDRHACCCGSAAGVVRPARSAFLVALATRKGPRPGGFVWRLAQSVVSASVRRNCASATGREQQSVAALLPTPRPFPMLGMYRAPGTCRSAAGGVGARQHVPAVGVSGRSPDGSEAKPRQFLLLSLVAAACRALVAIQPLPGRNAAQAYANWGATSRPGKQTGLASCCTAALMAGRSEGFGLAKSKAACQTEPRRPSTWSSARTKGPGRGFAGDFTGQRRYRVPVGCPLPFKRPSRPIHSPLRAPSFFTQI